MHYPVTLLIPEPAAALFADPDSAYMDARNAADAVFAARIERKAA